MAGAVEAAGDVASANDRRNDFDFFMGNWTCRHRRLRTPLPLGAEVLARRQGVRASRIMEFTRA